MENEFLNQMQILFKEEFHKTIPQWAKNASKNDIKGLKLTLQVVKNQGLRKFRPSKMVTPEVSIKSIFKPETHYKEAFGTNVSQKVFESEVLKFVNLANMKISQILRPEILMFLDRWFKLHDEEVYQNYVLSFIKGFFSVIKVNQAVLVSTSRESFSRKKIERIPVFGRKKWVDEEVRFKLPDLQKSKTPDFSNFQSSSSDVKKIVCRDHKDLLKWVTGQNQFKTMYQDQFHSKSVKILKAKKDFNTSTSIKLLPGN